MRRRQLLKGTIRTLALGLAAALLVAVPAAARSDAGSARPAATEAQGQTTRTQESPPPKTDFRIRLEKRQFTPSAGAAVDAVTALRGGQPGDRVHFFLQYAQMPTTEERQALEQTGVRFLNYVPENAYIASAPISELSAIGSAPGVRWLGPIQPDDKLERNVSTGRIRPWVRASKGRVAVSIQLHPDIAAASGEQLVTRYGGETVSVSPTIPSVTALLPLAAVRRLVREDAVQFVAFVERELEPENNGLVAAANVTPALRAAPYSLDGAGVTALVLDADVVDPFHSDFSGRLVESDPAGTVAGGTIGDHATHVAGILGGSGANSQGTDSAGNPNPGTSPLQFAGVAPKVRLRTYQMTDNLYSGKADLTLDLERAILAGTDLATMSMGFKVAGTTAFAPADCDKLGDYSETAIFLDELALGELENQELIFTISGGNERDKGPGKNCGDYATVNPPKSAKNVISVGAMNYDQSIAAFSSWGPVDDGRIKPDITAPGCNRSPGARVGPLSPSFIDISRNGVFNGVRDPGEVSNTYIVQCGTSMATPAVAGVNALLIQQWRSTQDTPRPRPDTMKAILVHSAREAATTATRATNLANANTNLMFKAVQAGSAGNAVTIEFAAPPPQPPPPAVPVPTPLSIAVAGSAIKVTLAGDATGAITSTATQVYSALLNDAAATAIVDLTAADGNEGEYTYPIGNTLAGTMTPMPPLSLSGGSNAPGPDYQFGWGIIDAQAGADLVADADNRITTTEVEHGDTVTKTFYSDGVGKVRSTLVWSDPPATQLANPALVNDLDVKLISPSGTPYLPWTLNPVTPKADAARGVDTRNNVEVVEGNPERGIWKVEVKGTRVAGIIFDEQKYTLITPPDGNSLSLTAGAVREGDTGTRKATFVVALAHADKEQRQVSYSTAGGTAGGSDFTAVNGTLTFVPGEIDKTVEVNVIGDIDPESTETFSMSVRFVGGPVDATAEASIVDDDSGTFTVLGKTGLGELTGVEPISVGVNDKGQVVFVGRTSSTNPYGQMGLWVGDRTAPAELVNAISSTSRVYNYPTIRNDGSVVAWDRLAGSPPSWYIREWTKPLLFGDWNNSVYERSGQGFDSVITPSASLENGHVAFTALLGSQAQVTIGAGGSGGAFNVDSASLPLISNDGAVVFRHVQKDSSGALDYENSAVRLLNFAGDGAIACNTGCPHPGFTRPGWRPGISHDGKTIAFFGTQTPPAGAPPGSGGPGIYASVRGANGVRTLVRIAKVGDAGITEFTQEDRDTRIAVNATQDDLNAVSIAFMAHAGASEAIYRARLVFEGGAANPTGFKAEGPNLVVRTGTPITDVGLVDDLALGDHALNNRNEGDLVFWAKAGGVEAALMAEAPDIPVLFVPGIAGSKLYDLQNNKSVWLWPFELTDPLASIAASVATRESFWSTHLSLREEDQAGKRIVATDALRDAVYGVAPIYSTIFDAFEASGYLEYDLGTNGANLRTCDLSQRPAKPNLFVFPYDWRKSNAVNAANLKAYMACVKQFYPDTKVNVVSHSMGGLLTRKTIISQSGFADEINTFLSIAPPWLGAPKLIYVLRSGDFIPTIASGPGVKRAAAALPGAHQLMPSQAYFDVSGSSPYGEEGRDYDGDGNDTEMYTDFAAVKALLDKKYARFKPGSTAGSFHGAAGQDDWSADTYGFKWFEIYGEQTDENTIGKVFETTKVICEAAAVSTPDTAAPGATCSTMQPIKLTFTHGDGTVPTPSAARTPAMLPPGSDPPIAFKQSVDGGDKKKYDHNGMLANEKLLAKVIQMLEEHGGPPIPEGSPYAPAGAAPLAQQDDVSSLRSSFTAETPPQAAAEEASVQAATEEAPAAPAAEPEPAIRSIAVYGAADSTASDAAGNTTGVTVDASNNVVVGEIPDVDVYRVDDDAQLYRGTSAEPLTVTFQSNGPVEVNLTKETNGVVTESTRFMDVGLPDGTPLKLTAAPGATPELAYDADGNGTYESEAAVDIDLVGLSAADATAPEVIVNSTLGADDLLQVSISAIELGSGLRSISYSLDGRTYQTYTGPFQVNPLDDLELSAFAEDFAGNRSPAEIVKVGGKPADRPTAGGIAVETDEDKPVSIMLEGRARGGSALRYTIVEQPSNGTVTVTGNTARYVPATDFNGTDTFRYAVDNSILRSEPATVTVDVKSVNDAPKITLTGATTAIEGQTGIPYSATAVDAEGETVTFAWNVAGGSLSAIDGNATLAVGDGPSTATIRVTATDASGGSSFVERTVTVRNLAPVVNAGLARTGYWGLPVSFVGSATDASAADTSAGFAVSWDFGDKTPTSSSFSAFHAYLTPGAYTSVLSVKDKDGATGTATSRVTVNKRTTTVAYTGSTGTTPYGFATLSAKLTDAVDTPTAKLAGKAVMFTVGTQAYTAAANASGVATAVLASPLPAGTYTVVARFLGDTLYVASMSAPASLKIASSVGSARGTGLVSLSNGASTTFDVSSTDGSVVRGTLTYALGATTIRATSIAPFGIAPDGGSAWFAGVSTAGQLLRIWVADGGPGPGPDRFRLWVNGVLRNGDGRLTGGEVTIAR